MGRDLQDDGVDDNEGLDALAALSLVGAVICFVALVAVLALCGSSVARSTHNSSPSTEAEHQPQSDSTPAETEPVPERQWPRQQEVADIPDRVRNLDERSRQCGTIRVNCLEPVAVIL